MASLTATISVNRRTSPVLYKTMDNECRVLSVKHSVTGAAILDGTGSWSIYSLSVNDEGETEYTLVATSGAFVGDGSGNYRQLIDASALTGLSEHGRYEIRVDLTSADGELHRRVRCYAVYRGVT